MQVLLRVDGDDPQVVRSLREWLQGDPSIRPYGELRWARDGAPEQMGMSVDVLALALGTGISASQLVFTVAEWRRSRHPSPIVVITRPGHVSVRISSSDQEALAEAVRRLETI